MPSRMQKLFCIIHYFFAGAAEAVSAFVFILPGHPAAKAYSGTSGAGKTTPITFPRIIAFLLIKKSFFIILNSPVILPYILPTR
jgi:hypothetical protein